MVGTAVAGAAATQTMMNTQTTAACISNNIRGRFGANGVVVLRQCSSDKQKPLVKIACPKFEELLGVESERRLAAALACTLLSAEAVQDPQGEWGTGWTHAHDHYAYANLLEQPKRTVVIVLPREPVTLTLRGYPEHIIAPTPYSSTSHTPVFSANADELSFDSARPPAEPEIHLDPGDAIVLRGDHTELPGGLGAGSLVYTFRACEASDRLALDWSPTLQVRRRLQRALEAPGVEGVDE